MKNCLKALPILLLSASISVVWAGALQRSSQACLPDFRAIYFGARCVLEHRDPYKLDAFLQVYRESGGQFPRDPALALYFGRAVPICVNLPTALLFAAPMLFLPWSFASSLWFILEAAALVLAAYLIVSLSGLDVPGVSILLTSFLLANCENVLSLGNLAALVVGACVAAIWCIDEARFPRVGILLLALTLVLKPHDSGLIWLYILLFPGFPRKSGIQSLVLTLGFGLLSYFWIWHAAPNWFSELRSNLSLTSARGGLSDPGPLSLTGRGPDAIIDLQSVISYFRDDPAFYNLATYTICGTLLLIWLIATIRSRRLHEHRWFALSVVVPLSLLITYHRVYDAKLLLLTVPACAALWAQRGVVKWLAFLIHGITFLLCGDITYSLLLMLESKMNFRPTGALGTILKIVMERPIPVALLMMTIFYLVIYVRRVWPQSVEATTGAAG